MYSSHVAYTRNTYVYLYTIRVYKLVVGPTAAGIVVTDVMAFVECPKLPAIRLKAQPNNYWTLE